MTWLSDGNPAGETEPPVPPTAATVADQPAATDEPWTPPKYPDVGSSVWPLAVATIWLAAALGAGLYFIFGVNAETYGGDAYTGIEAAIVTAVKGIGWLLIGSGVLGLVVAGSRAGSKN